MRHRFIFACAVFTTAFGLSNAALALSSLRVGNQVLVAGDSSARVTALLGKPSHKSGSRRSSSRGSRTRSGSSSRRGGVRVIDADAGRGEKWEYRRDDHVTTVTIVDGKVSDIDDERL